ncbi:MAG: peptidyl-prolyl cis-trans isomerase [Ilumatobacteraceae bacterium]|nr:peptidyl-prolyl cis-trans isomerase [Ilumatobacteraceae bacterium]
MGTDKRERQKANRQLKLEEMARDARKRKTKKRGLQIGVGVPVLIILVFVLVRLFSNDNNTNSVSTTGSSVATDTGVTSTTSGTPGVPLPCPNVDGSSTKTTTFPAAPSMCIDTTKKYTVTVTTSLGAYTAELDASKAPKTVNNFVYLALYHYYDNTPCHRIITGFVIQCGDPTGTGQGGPGYSFADELPKAGEYKLGSLAMANSGPDTNGSQFFVISGNDGIALPPSYSLFGQVTSGLDVVAKLDAVGSASGTPSTPVTIQTVTVTVA